MPKNINSINIIITNKTKTVRTKQESILKERLALLAYFQVPNFPCDLFHALQTAHPSESLKMQEWSHNKHTTARQQCGC